MIMFNVSCPASEYSTQFIEGMISRMGTSFHKYGAVKDAYPDKFNALESFGLRMKKFRETKNMEYLIDSSNFLMIEFMFPSDSEYYFKAEDSSESPGRINESGEVSYEGNK